MFGGKRRGCCPTADSRHSNMLVSFSGTVVRATSLEIKVGDNLVQSRNTDTGPTSHITLGVLGSVVSNF